MGMKKLLTNAWVPPSFPLIPLAPPTLELGDPCEQRPEESFLEERLMCQAVPGVSCDKVSTAGSWLSLGLGQSSLNKLLRCEHHWHYVFFPLFLGRWKSGKQPASSIGPARAKDVAFGLEALTEAKVGVQPPVPACHPAGSRRARDKSWGSPGDATGRLSPQSSGLRPSMQ